VLLESADLHQGESKIFGDFLFVDTYVIKYSQIKIRSVFFRNMRQTVEMFYLAMLNNPFLKFLDADADEGNFENSMETSLSKDISGKIF